MGRLSVADPVFTGYDNETKIRHFWKHLDHCLEIGPTQVTITPR